MSSLLVTMYNNRSCPHTPAPRKAGPRFPMSAAILETPSIMSSFRELEQPNGAANASHPPAPKQFIMSYSSNAPNGRNGCVEKATVNQQRHDLNATQSLNGSFLDCSFSSSFTTSMTTQNRKVPLANSSTNNLKTNTTLKGWSSSSKPTVGLQNLHRSSASSGGGSNVTCPSYTGTTFGHEKRKHPAEHSASKYSKTTAANFPKGSSTLTAATGDVSAGTQQQNLKPASLRILSGTIEHLQKAIREQSRQVPLLLETVANVISIKPGTKVKEKIILLRHRNQGPVMQGVFYEIDHDLPPLAPGDLVRCVGRLQPVGSRLQILKINRTTEAYGRAIMRLQTVSAFTAKVRR